MTRNYVEDGKSEDDYYLSVIYFMPNSEMIVLFVMWSFGILTQFEAVSEFSLVIASLVYVIHYRIYRSLSWLTLLGIRLEHKLRTKEK